MKNRKSLIVLLIAIASIPASALQGEETGRSVDRTIPATAFSPPAVGSEAPPRPAVEATPVPRGFGLPEAVLPVPTELEVRVKALQSRAKALDAERAALMRQLSAPESGNETGNLQQEEQRLRAVARELAEERASIERARNADRADSFPADPTDPESPKAEEPETNPSN